MIKILVVIGTRPQIIKAAALSRAIKNDFKNLISEKILHTGQHYDQNMSEIFINELELPLPDYNLNIGSNTHGSQTGKMIEGIEKILLQDRPDAIVLFGDTNSTLAGSIAASKLNIPIIHIEAGLRSYNKSMPEEINRLLCDHVSTILCCPTQNALNNLLKEGFIENNYPPYSIDNPLVLLTGDIMFDNALYYENFTDEKSHIISDLKLKNDEYILVTIHRAYNTDNIERLNYIFKILTDIASYLKTPIVMPLHPRSLQKITLFLRKEIYSNFRNNKFINILQPVSFFDMINLEKNCKFVITDSGGVQKEAYFFKKPVIIFRKETEWIEIVETGAARITDLNEKKIFQAVDYFSKTTFTNFPPLYGNGKAAQYICNIICDLFNFIK